MAKHDIQLSLSAEELKAAAITSLVIGFVISYNHWGFGESAVISTGILNWILAGIICLGTIWLRSYVQKYVARTEQTVVTYEAKPANWFWTVFLGIISSGFFVLASGGRPKVKSVTVLRSGHREPHLSPFRQAAIIASGFIVSFALIIIANFWLSYGDSILADYLLRTNIWMALVGLLPLPFEGYSLKQSMGQVKQMMPTFEGEHIFFGSPALWTFLAVAAIALSGFISFGVSTSISLIISLAVGFAAGIAWIYFKQFGG